VSSVDKVPFQGTGGKAWKLKPLDPSKPGNLEPYIFVKRTIYGRFKK
jgi:hypothetical protein